MEASTNYGCLDRVCFIKTTNLDGESNLKIRRPIDLRTGDAQLNDAEVMRLKGVLQCEAPNANLHKFQGRFEADNSDGSKGSASCLLLSFGASTDGRIIERGKPSSTPCLRSKL